MTTLTGAPPYAERRNGPSSAAPNPARLTRGQFARFSLVGLLNTAIDVLALNLMIWAFALHTTETIMVANAAAYALGAINSFALNKRWTFGRRNPITVGEIGRFVAVTLAGAALNDALLWLASQALWPILGPTALWANAAKVCAIGGSVTLSFLGMRLWVFAQQVRAPTTLDSQQRLAMARDERNAVSVALARHSVSIVLPAYNEEMVILNTVSDVVNTLADWGADYEVIVVNDGSSDLTGVLVAAYTEYNPRIRLITHATNQGYGAALADGFAAATKDLTLFMDSDGQFAISDLTRLLVHIDEVDAVLGYRLHRQDAWLRQVNAWGWKQLVRLTLGVTTRDLDCAFKLLRTDFLRRYPPTTRSALINAELLYTLTRVGATYREVGVRHLPRAGGRATGANPRVIIRALWDLLTHARQWRRREYGTVEEVTASPHMARAVETAP